MYTKSGPVYLLDTLSANGTSNLVGIYSLQRLLTSYSGSNPIIQLMSYSPTVTQNFYSDSSGNLWTGTNGTGSTIFSWFTTNSINNTTKFAYVSTWYDQSGRGMHATQPTQNLQPRFNITNYVIDFGCPQTGYFQLPVSSNIQSNAPWTVSFKLGTMGTSIPSNTNYGSGSCVFMNGGPYPTGSAIHQSGLAVDANWNGVYGTWSWYGDWNSSASVKNNNTATVTWNGTGTGSNTMSIFVNNSTSTANVTNTMSGFVGGYGGNLYIGYDSYQRNNALSSEMYYLSLFSSNIATSDRTLVESQVIINITSFTATYTLATGIVLSWAGVGLSAVTITVSPSMNIILPIFTTSSSKTSGSYTISSGFSPGTYTFTITPAGGSVFSTQPTVVVTSPYYYTPSLLCYYDMYNGSYPGSGSTVTDLSPNGLNMIMSTGGSPTTSGFTYISNGAKSLQWTSTSLYGLTNFSSGINFNTTGLTFELLVNATGSYSGGPTIMNIGTAYNSILNNIYIASTGKIATNNGDSSTSTYTVPSGTWVHIVVTSSSCIYVNGILQSSSGTFNLANSISNDFELNNYQGASYALLGYFALVRLYSTPLTSNQVLQNYISIANTSLNPYGLPQVYEYPSAPLTTSNTIVSGVQYGSGLYFSNASSNASAAYLALNKYATTGNVWIASSATYGTSSPYAYSGTSSNTIVSGTTYNGEWIQVNTPKPITLTGYSITSSNDSNYGQTPSSWIVAGLNGSTWIQVDSRVSTTFTSSNQTILLPVTPSNTYSSYRFIWQNLSSSSTGIVSLAELRLYAQNSLGALYYNDGSLLTGWTTTSGVSINTTDGQTAPPCIQVNNNLNYAYYNTIANQLGTSISVNVKLVPGGSPFAQIFFACNSSGAGYAVWLDARGYGYNSGFTTSTSWTSVNQPTTQASVNSGTWYNVLINILPTGYATWYLNGVIKDSGYYTGVTLNPYIGFGGGDATSNGALFDSITVYPSFDQYWSNVALYTQFDEIPGSYTFIDQAGKQTITALRSQTVLAGSTGAPASGVFGSFLGPNLYGGLSVTTLQQSPQPFEYGITISPNASLCLGNANFTIEMWIYTPYNGSTIYGSTVGSGANRLGGNMGGLGAQYWSGNSFILIPPSAGGWGMQTNNNGITVEIPSTGSTGWHHYAVTRNASNLYAYIDGVKSANTAITVTVDGGSVRTWTFGFAWDTFVGNYSYTFLDDIRITPGIDRYSNGSNFTPPLAEYSVTPVPLTPNLIAYYDFSQLACYNPLLTNIGVIDLSATKTNMIFNSAPTLDTTGPGGSTMGVILGASTYADNTSITYNLSTGYTVCVLFKLTTLPTSTYPCVFGLASGAYGNNQNGFGLCITPTGYSPPSVPYFASGTTTFSSNVVLTNTALGVGTYYHIVVTVSSAGAGSSYINGSLANTFTTVLPSGTLSGYIGTGFILGSGATITGTTSICKLYNTALTPAQAISEYTSVIGTSNPYGLPTYTTSNLIAYWDFSKTSSYSGSGTTLTDISPGGTNTLNITNPGTFTNSTQKYMSFAANTYAYKSAVSYNFAPTGLTYEILVNPQTTTNYLPLIWFANTGNPPAGFLLQSTGTSGISQQFGTWNGGGNMQETTLTFTTNTWYHIVVTDSSTGVVQWYINNLPQVNFIKDNSANVIPTTTTANIGMGDASLGTILNKGFNGYYALGRIYNRPLTSAEVNTNYNSIIGNGGDPYISNVQLLLHLDNSGTDSSINNATMTSNGTISYSSSIYIFGGYSLYTGPSSANRLDSPSSSIYRLLNGNFTIEFWFYNISNTTSAMRLMGNCLGYGWATSSWVIGSYSGHIGFETNQYGQVYGTTSPFNSSPGTWHHFAVVRNGIVLTTYLDGVQDAQNTNYGVNIDGSVGTVVISTGGSGNGNFTTEGFNGYMDDVRVTIGTARYLSNFVVPTSPFQNTVFNPYGLPTYTPGYLDTLSTKTYLRGVFCLKTLFTASSNKPLVNVSNALTGGITQDFYGNSTGTVLVSTSNGIPLSTWLSVNGSSTGYVQTWYDQSQYVNGGTAYNATAVTRPTINTTTTPWSVDGTNGGYFNLPGGTIPLNSTYTLSAKANNGSGAGGIFGGGKPTNSNGNNLRFNISPPGFYNYWYLNDYFYSSSSNTQPIVTSVINYVTGSAPTSNMGVVFTGGTSSTSYTTAAYMAGNSATNPTAVRTGWSGISDVNDLLMKTKADVALGSQMFWGVVSLQAVSDSDRNIIEGIGNPYGLNGFIQSVSGGIPLTQSNISGSYTYQIYAFLNTSAAQSTSSSVPAISAAGSTSTTTYTVIVTGGSLICDILAVGGGGSGGSTDSGGGGAGGVVFCPSFTLPAGSYTFVVGNGGISPGGGSSLYDLIGNSGANTYISGSTLLINAVGGGGGGVGWGGNGGNSTGKNGGSGGGSGAHDNGSGTGTGGSVTTGIPSSNSYGFAGGTNSSTNNTFCSGGGGGAGGAGGNGISGGASGAGGIGLSTISTYVFGQTYNLFATGFTSIGQNSSGTYYFAGGGGGGFGTGNTSGGLGGGGNGTWNSSGANAGLSNTGGGGGGGGSGFGAGGGGGSGVILLRYRTA